VLRALARIAWLSVTHPRRLLSTVHGVLTGPDGECPCCNHVGAFLPAGLVPSWQCPKCLSLHRHRLLALAMADGFVDFAGADVLHFAPEKAVARLIRARRPASYRAADIARGRAETVLDIEKIDLPSASVDRVLALHVLEHVDDCAALAELHRILRPGGVLIAMVPIVEGWDRTYEDPAVQAPHDQAAHFGQASHVRYYGRDFRDRLAEAGLRVSEFTAGGPESARYRLKRGCKVFRAVKASA
jgi:SAM-dependent methyltransferase